MNENGTRDGTRDDVRDDVLKGAVPLATIATPIDEGLAGQPRAIVEAALAKVLDSAVFRRSERHRRFMRHIVEATLDGRRDQLKEMLLGIALFDRKAATFDPRSDPIVRVEAGRIRDKLARYYAGDGTDDALSFSIPVGSYVPLCERKKPASQAARPVESFAVLPFATASGEQDTAFAIGLADQLITMLGRGREVKVIARVSAFKARERNLDIRDIGRLLKVTRVVDGSLQRQGDRMRCIAHIYRARDGERLWSESFDSDVVGIDRTGRTDLFAFQDHIAARVRGAAVAPQTASASASSSGMPSSGVVVPVSDVSREDRHAARDRFERASYLARRYDSATGARAIELFEQAVALDPGHAATHVALATAYFHQTTLLTAPGRSMLPRIEQALARALALDPTNSDAIALRAMVTFRIDADWPRAERLLHEAIGLSPHNSEVNYRYAFCLIVNGAFEAGLRHARASVDLDPLNLGRRASCAQLLAYAREYERAEDEARNVLELEPNHLYMNWVLALIHLYNGAFAEAVARFEGIIAHYPDHPAAHLGRISALGRSGDVARGERDLALFLERMGARYVPPHSLALAFVCIGDDRACDAALARAAADGDPGLCTLPVDPLFKHRHADPAFRAWMTTHGMRSPVD